MHTPMCTAHAQTKTRVSTCTRVRTPTYCNRRNFRTRFNFVLSAESTKFSSSIRKPCTYNSVCNTVLAVRKFIAYKSSKTLEYEIFTHMKISAITVHTYARTRHTHRHSAKHSGMHVRMPCEHATTRLFTCQCTQTINKHTCHDR